MNLKKTIAEIKSRKTTDRRVGDMYVTKSINANHEDLIHDVAYDFYGKRMATCSSDQKVKVWDQQENGEWVCSARCAFAMSFSNKLGHTEASVENPLTQFKEVDMYVTFCLLLQLSLLQQLARKFIKQATVIYICLSCSWKSHYGSVWKVNWAHPEFGQV